MLIPVFPIRCRIYQQFIQNLMADQSIEHHAKCIERIHRMLELLDTSIDLLRTKHKNGEVIADFCITLSFPHNS